MERESVWASLQERFRKRLDKISNEELTGIASFYRTIGAGASVVVFAQPIVSTSNAVVAIFIAIYCYFYSRYLTRIVASRLIKKE